MHPIIILKLISPFFYWNFYNPSQRYCLPQPPTYKSCFVPFLPASFTFTCHSLHMFFLQFYSSTRCRNRCIIATYIHTYHYYIHTPLKFAQQKHFEKINECMLMSFDSNNISPKRSTSCIN